ncbi:MAG: hypothetical protein M0Q91_11895 [Methanoregula sp.]|jgi:acylphosphatase|nr:hypothetical protein [Methanoregula sp.]
MAYSIALTKRTNGGYTVVANGVTSYPSEVIYHGTEDGVILYARGLNLLRFYRPTEWTIQTVATYTTVVQVCDALDALGVLPADTLEDIEALLTTIDADTGAIKTAVEIMAGWDESDRAKVNPIAGQAGIAAGAGAVADTVPRVTLASDDPAVVALQIIDNWDESNRAKVNLIAGQAGVDGNSGNLSNRTVRVAVATDDINVVKVVTAVEKMDNWDENDRAKVNLIASQAGVDGNSGNKSDKTVRVVLATDQPALTNKLLVTEDNSGAIKTAVELIDNAVDGNYLNTNLNIAGTDAAAGTGTQNAQTIRVVIATDQAQLTNSLKTVDDNGAAIKTAVELIDNAVDGNFLNTNMNVAGTDVAAGTGTQNAQTLRVVLATDQAQLTNSLKVVDDNGSAVKTAVELIDDTVKVLGTDTYTEASTKGLVVGAFRRDAETTMVDTTNEVAPLQVDAAGRLKVTSQGRNSAPAVLVAAGSAQNVTTGWVDFGSEITTGGAELLALWLVVTHTDSANVRARILAKHTGTTGVEFTVPIKTVSSNVVKAQGHYYELDTDATQNIVLDWDISAVPVVQVQISCETVGSTADTVSADYTLKF